LKLIVLAGGFGSRLKSVVSNVPKPLAPVNGSPFLTLQIKNWLNQGIRDFTFLLYYEADQIISVINQCKENLQVDCKINWVIEPNPLLTGGAVANAVCELGLIGDFLITNADTWLESGINELSQVASPAIAVVKVDQVQRYGKVNYGIDQIITSFAEKSISVKPEWINAGLYRLNAEVFESWDGKAFSLETDLFPKLVSRKALSAVPVETNFIDIGVPEDYKRFCFQATK
jgi:D-glycero-alpha-D-manno-heptose 1-phosphate guanylyltransferase